MAPGRKEIVRSLTLYRPQRLRPGMDGAHRPVFGALSDCDYSQRQRNSDLCGKADRQTQQQPDGTGRRQTKATSRQMLIHKSANAAIIARRPAITRP